MQVLVIGKEGVCLSTVEVIVPNAEQGENNRSVLFHRSACEVVVHVVCSRQKLLEIVEPCLLFISVKFVKLIYAYRIVIKILKAKAAEKVFKR